MKTIDTLRRFYKTELVPDLWALECTRKTVARNALITGGAVFIVTLMMGAVLMLLAGWSTAYPVIIILFAGTAGAGALIWWMGKGFRSAFKGVVIRKLVKFIDENLQYDPQRGITETVFKYCHIFKRRLDRYRSEDLVCGRLGDTEVAFSEVHAEYRSRDSKGNSHWHTIFKGLFFVADFHKDFKSKTIVLPDTAERMLGGLGKMFQSWNIMRDQLIKLEDPEFEREFVVYGSNQIEARYILSTSLMQRIVQFKRKTGKRIQLSFVGSKVFVAIPYHKNLFEPRLFHTLLDFGPIADYFGDLQIATGIVEDLNLNTRIWSKV